MDKEKSQREESRRVLIAGGGTGGHLFPALAIIEELEARIAEIGAVSFLFIGTKRGIESTVLDDQRYAFKTIWIRGFQRGFHLKDILTNLLFPLRLFVSLIHSYFIIRSFDPDFAIGTGGYTSGPPLRIAALLKIPIFLHEQNVWPGATTRMLAKHARRIYTSYQSSNEYLEEAVCYGTPLRRSLKRLPQEQALQFFELYEGLKTVFIFGGSQGSLAINRYLLEHIDAFIEHFSCQFIWQTGQRDFEMIRNRYFDNPNIYITPFIHEVGIAYSAADLVVSRAGALTLAELCLYGKPSLLIPLPTAAGNHQEINANLMQTSGASLVISQHKLDSEELMTTLGKLLPDNQSLKKMAQNARKLAQPDSAKLIVDDIVKTLEEDVEQD